MDATEPSTAILAPERAIEIADAMFAAIEACDIDALRDDIYAPDVVVWHNNDGIEQGRDDNLKVLKWMGRNISELRYEQIRRSATATGFVQQHVLRGTAPNGNELDVPACLVVTIDNDRVTRIDEYLDSATLKQFAG